MNQQTIEKSFVEDQIWLINRSMNRLAELADTQPVKDKTAYLRSLGKTLINLSDRVDGK